MADRKPWLQQYTGQSVDELIALEETHEVPSLVLAFEEAIMEARQLREEKGEPLELSSAEITILGVEGLEREVDNGGYW